MSSKEAEYDDGSNVSIEQLSRLAMQVYYDVGQLPFSGVSFDCGKVGPEQKNIFFLLYTAFVCSIKDIDYRFLPHGKQILHSLERAFESTDLAPYHLSLTRLLL